MDIDMAMRIVKSRDKINVNYNGSPVWIQGINGPIAKVKFLNTGREDEVPVSDLVRQK